MVWAALVNALVLQSCSLMGIFVLLSLHTYLRPHQLLSVGPRSVIPPTPGACQWWSLVVHPEGGPTCSKTGEYNVSIVLDNPKYQWMNPVWATAHRLARSRLFNFDFRRTPATSSERRKHWV